MPSLLPIASATVANQPGCTSYRMAIASISTSVSIGKVLTATHLAHVSLLSVVEGFCKHVRPGRLDLAKVGFVDFVHGREVGHI